MRAKKGNENNCEPLIALDARSCTTSANVRKEENLLCPIFAQASFFNMNELCSNFADSLNEI